MTEEEAKDHIKSVEIDFIFGIRVVDGLDLRRFTKDEFEEINEGLATSPSLSLSSAEFTLEKRVRSENEMEFERIRLDIHKTNAFKMPAES